MTLLPERILTMRNRPAWRSVAAALVLALVPSVAAAQVTVTDPWVRGTVAGQRATGAFMKLTATGNQKLVAAASPVAKIVEIHEMAMDGGVMRMRAIPKLDLPAGKPTELKPGGYHVMLMALDRTLADGEIVPITLTFEDAAGKRQSVEVKAPVRPLTAAPPSQPAKH
jgi:periplasmic copper chaperone A